MYLRALAILSLLALAGCATAPSHPSPPSSKQGAVPGKFQSWRERRDHNVIKQRYDYSCGAAALATLLRYYFADDRLDERGILEGIMGRLSEDETGDRIQNGFSLLDLKQQAERLGYQAAGVKLGLGRLPKLRGPVLVHLVCDGERHFAILRGVREDRVFLADPSRGNVRMPVHQFAREWTGLALVLGKKGFGLPAEHALAVPSDTPLRPELDGARRALVAR